MFGKNQDTFFSASFSMRSFSIGVVNASFVASEIIDVLASSSSVLPINPENVSTWWNNLKFQINKQYLHSSVGRILN